MDIINKLGNKGLVFIVSLIIVLFFQYFAATLNQVDKFAIHQDNLSLAVEYGHLTINKNNSHVADINNKLDEFKFGVLNQVSVGFSSAEHWYLLKLKNTQNIQKDIVLFFDNSMMDVIDVYDGTQQPQLIATLGDTRHLNSVDLLAFPRVSIAMAAKSSKSILIKTQTTGTAIFPISIFAEKDFSSYKDSVYLIWGAFIGVALIMCIYNLILFAGVNDKLYLLYIGYVISFLFTLGVIHGFLVYLVPTSLFEFVSTQIVSFQYITAFFALSFGMYFLRYDEEPNRLITKVAKAVCVYYLISSVVNLLIPEQQAAPLFFLSQLVLYIIAFVFICQKVRERASWAYFYLMSWLPLFTGAAIGPLLVTGNLEYSFWTRHALMAGVLFEMTFISMGLAYRLRTSEAQRLFQASHDNFFKFANRSLLETKAKLFLRRQQGQSLTVVVVTVTKYDTLVPYLPEHNLKQFIYQLVADTERHLSTELMLLDIDEVSKFKKTAMIREGVFGFVVSSNDRYLLSNVLNLLAANQPLNYQSGDLSINFSCLVGAASSNDNNRSTSNLVNRALQAIDIAVENDKQWWIYSAENKSAEGRKVQLASELVDAIENNLLSLYHQPQISIDSKHIVGSEVLLRWQHPKLGYIATEEFVSIAEDTGLVNKLSQWVFETACNHLRSLISAGHDSHRISVNISAYDVMSQEFHSFLVSKLKDYNLAAKQFILEVTETVAINDDNKFAKQLTELKDLGFNLAMDDFGTGYSSLTYVSRHPFDEIKIDREFVGNIHFSDKNHSIVAATINMAKGLNVKVIAEGIESLDNLLTLKSLGCELGQGYFISKPVPLDLYLDWLDEQEGYLEKLLQ